MRKPILRYVARAMPKARYLVLPIVLGAACLACEKDPAPTSASKPSTSAVAARASGASPVPAPAPKPKGPPGPLNVLMVTIDALRNDMPWSGYGREIAPNLTRLSKKGALYTNHYSMASYTAKSVAGMLASRYPSTLYRNGVFFTTYAQANVFLPEVLQEKGIRTMGWHSHLYFGRGKGFDQGFDVWEMVPGITFDPQTDNHVTSPKTTELGIKILGDPANTGKQFFAWTHYTDPHDVYVKHEESPDFGNKNRDRYDSEVYYADMWVGKLLDWAEKQPWWTNTALVISSDHGEAFGEHSMYRHAFDIWEVLTRVPLMIIAPGIEPIQIDDRRSQIDLAPTILELMGVPSPPQFMGKSLVKEIYGIDKPENREPIILDLPEDTNNPQRRAVIQGDYKLTVYDAGYTKRLFNLRTDPGEEKDLAKDEPETFTQMVALYEETFKALPLVVPFGGSKLVSGRVANGPLRPPAPVETKAADGGASRP